MGKSEVNLVIPWPPTVNHYWGQRHGGRGRYIKAAGLRFRTRVKELIEVSGITLKLYGCTNIKVAAVASAPDRRERDLDNLWKATLDALQHAELYRSDGLINSNHMDRGPVDPAGNGFINLHITGDHHE